ncbi:hypothetical protein [Telluribacter sp.]|jgi:hypothetical protein|uniref:hypothetical protein n=1 Tax=Telluribacter sp. TaxID=1978767 RepID=UPI002E136755|nr:hypothetical protein [Telluribacter sp.]
MEAKEAPKRKYKKHKTDIKITVKHYFNDRIKMLDEYDKEKHPLYLKIIMQQKTTYYKSKLEIFGNPGEMYLTEQLYGKALEEEKEGIIELINESTPATNPSFSLSEIMFWYRSQPSLMEFVNQKLVFELTEAIFDQEEKFEGVIGSDTILKNVPALMLYDKYKELSSVKKVKESYPEMIWYLPYYYEIFCSKLHSSYFYKDYAYHLLKPSVKDYLRGGFKAELLIFYATKNTGSQLVKSIDGLLEKYI